MSHTVYITSQDLSIETVINALGGKYTATIEQWEETKTTTFTKKGKELTKTKTTFTAVLLVESEAIEALKHYVRVMVHRNFYPREWHDPLTLYIRVTPDEKRRVTQILSSFKNAVPDFTWEYIPKNGYGFLHFGNDKYVPQVAGLLKAYPELSGMQLNYAKTQEERAPAEEKPQKRGLKRTKDGTIVFNAPLQNEGDI